MKQSKKIEELSEGQTKDSTNSWKTKAIIRRQENEKLRKRIKELTHSRDSWKSKYKALKKKDKSADKLGSTKAFKHQYSLVVIALIVELYKYGGMSLRSCRHSLCCLFLHLGMSSRIPSHSSIRNWLCKCGIHRVEMNEKSDKEDVLYLDESITFGSEKILLILGVSSEQIKEDKALSQEDMSVLYVGASNEWKAETIEKQVQRITASRKVKYVVSDEGRNLCKAYKLLDYIHIEDCTHVLAKYLKRIYEKDADFEAFRKLVGKLRQGWNLSKTKSQYMPPTMRGKMRFANIFPCVNWAKKMLENWQYLDTDVQDSLQFLKDNSDFIQSLIEVELLFKIVCTELKNKGFGQVQKQRILVAFSKMKVGLKASIFMQNCKDYLENLTTKNEILKQKQLLCSSDIIESFFGKFKAKVNSNSRSGLTEFIFTMATFGQPFSLNETKMALESVKCKDLVLKKNLANTG